MTVKTIQSLQDLDPVRPHWEQWQTHVNSDLAQFELVCTLRPEVEAPFVTVLQQGDRLQALLVGRLERTHVAPSIGYLQPVRVPARVVAMIHQGLVGQLDDRDATEMVRHLWSMLRSGTVDAVNFHHLSEQSPLLRALWRESPRWLCEKTPRWSTHREMILPSGGGLMDTKIRAKHRSRIRKRQKDLEKAFEGRLTWRWLTDVDDVADLCARLEDVAASTYQRGLGAGFFNNEEFRRRFQLFASRRQLRLQLLEIDGKIKAFWFGTVYRGVFHSSETGYDPELRDYEVGTLMFIRMVDELAREGVQRLDFGLGDALYKERFGDLAWRETSVWMFAPTPKGVLLMLLIRLSVGVDTLAREIVKRIGLTDRLKALWRRNRTKATPQPAGEGGS